MQTSVQFLKQGSNRRSKCGDTLDIDISSASLGWEGILVEKGMASHFHPTDVYTPYFYFALDIGQKLHWQAEKNGAMIQLKTTAGSIWMNPPRSSFTHVIDEPCYFILLAITEEAMYTAFDGPLKPDQLQFLKSYNIDDDTLQNMIQMFFREARNKGKTGVYYLNSLIKLFANYFIRNYSNYEDLSADDLHDQTIREKDLKRIESYIDAHLTRGITIDDVAATLNMSKFYFLKEFKKRMGLTPYQFILNKKMEKSKLLLKDQGYTIADIAYRLGFSDQSHFSNTFKKFFNITPKKYRDTQIGTP